VNGKDNLKALNKVIGGKIIAVNTDGTDYNAYVLLEDGRSIRLNGFDWGLTVTVDKPKKVGSK
jgi:hypothetical protein